MAISGSINFSLDRDGIINRALRIIGVVAQGQTATATQISEAAIALNAMIKAWQAEGLQIWKVLWYTFPLQTSSEVTGTDGNIYTCIKSHTSNNNNKPITGNLYSNFWKQTGATGGLWANTTAYTSVGDIPLNTIMASENVVLGILEAFLRSDMVDTPVKLITRAEYMAISDKTTTGKINRIYLENQTPKNVIADYSNTGNVPRIYTWPQSDNTTDVLHCSLITRTYDFDAATDDPDFEQKWLDALCFSLAYKISFEYSIGLTERQFLLQESERLKMIARNDCVEYANLKVSPRMR